MTPFGTTQNGQPVHAITLRGGPLSVTILTLGAILQDVRLAGVDHSLTLGSDRLADYEDSMVFHGGIVGPVANRLSQARAPIAGALHHFDANLAGQHTLHGGSAGTHGKVWQVDEVTDNTAILSHVMPDGEAGFPGYRKITATFEVFESAALRLTLTTTSDAPSIANATNHSYWNLDGSGQLQGHSLQLDADHYLPIDDGNDGVPTGEIAPVADTGFDCRMPRPLVPAEPPLDNTFCVARARRPLTACGTLKGASGVTMRISTTEPGFHLYDGRAAKRPNGAFYEGLAIECQGWPDAPNAPDFPSIAVNPDAPVTQITQWQFARS